MADESPESLEGAQELRLFPLNVVLFPGMQMPLRIFEERYKLMIGECLDFDEPFGVVLIKEGKEVGGPATPHAIGTAARITNSERLEGGRMSLATVGERRFRIVETVQELPYLKGRVEYLAEDTGQLEDDVFGRARTLITEYLRGLASLQGGWVGQVEVPDDSARLSYAVAEYLDLPAVARQRLLELPHTAERLQFEIPLLEGAGERLREELQKRSPYQGPRLN